jgi:hypothetical protein
MKAKNKTRIANCICGGNLIEPTKLYLEVGPDLKNVVICETCEAMYGEPVVKAVR